MDLFDGSIRRGGNSVDVLFRPKYSLHLGTFNIHPLTQVRQQAALTRTRENSKIDVYCLCKTRTQNPTFGTSLRSPDTPFPRFILPLSGGSVLNARGQAGFGIALSIRAERVLLDWVPINSRLCRVRLGGFVRVNSSRLNCRCLFVLFVCASTD